MEIPRNYNRVNNTRAIRVSTPLYAHTCTRLSIRVPTLTLSLRLLTCQKRACRSSLKRYHSKSDSRMGHPSALHRPEYSHINPPFLSCPCLQQAVRQKNTSTRGYLMLNIHPSSRTRKNAPGVNVVTAAYRHGINERNCALSNNSRHHDSIPPPPQRTPVTNTYIKTYEHVMLLDIASSLSRRLSRNATKQLRSLE